MSRKGIAIICSVIGLLFVSLIVYLVTVKDIDQKIRQDSRFSYQTSLSDNYGSRSKADIYKSSLDFKDTVKVIKKLKKPEFIQQNEANQYAQLAYHNHEVLIYQDEERKEILVQVAELQYLRNNGYGHMYRGPRLGALLIINDYHYNRGHSYRSNSSYRKTSSYSSKKSTHSVRQGSSGSRNSVGGGTGFGK